MNVKASLYTLSLIILIGNSSYSMNIESSYMLDNDDKYRVTRTDKIEMWSNSKDTQNNIKSKQYAKFSGYNELTKSYQDYTIELSDYDTHIINTYQKDGKYYIKDNSGRVFETGSTGLTQTQINKLNKIDANQHQIQQNSARISQLNNRLDSTNQYITDVKNQMEAGLATVTALTSLHPNPKAKGRTQIAIGSGIYRDNAAGALGIFHHIKDNIMISAGAAYGGNSDWAGNVGITFSIGD